MDLDLDLELEVEPVHKNTNVVIDMNNQPLKMDTSWMVKPEEIKYIEPSEEEKKLLEGTISAKEFVENEKKEVQEELTEKEKEELKRKDYITKVKVLALYKCKFYPLSNPSEFKPDDKLRVKNKMAKIIQNYTEEELTEEFNIIVRAILEDSKTNYENLSIMRK